MEHIILSLLLIKSMTVYEIKMFIGQNLTTVCSDSLGSIQTAIKKLLSKECVEVREYIENNLLKKEYSITDKGTQQFREWIEVPMNLEKVKNMEEGKFFFLGMVPKEVRIQSLEGYIQSLVKEKEKLCTIQAYVEENKAHAIEVNVERIKEDEQLTHHLLMTSEQDSLHQAVQNIYDYQMYSLEYGLARLEQDIVFYERILQKEKES